MAQNVSHVSHGKLTVNLVSKAAADLMATRSRGLSQTDIVNRAVSPYSFLDECESGGKIFIRPSDGKVTPVELV